MCMHFKIFQYYTLQSVLPAVQTSTTCCMCEWLSKATGVNLETGGILLKDMKEKWGKLLLPSCSPPEAAHHCSCKPCFPFLMGCMAKLGGGKKRNVWDSMDCSDLRELPSINPLVQFPIPSTRWRRNPAHSCPLVVPWIHCKEDWTWPSQTGSYIQHEDARFCLICIFVCFKPGVRVKVPYSTILPSG